MRTDDTPALFVSSRAPHNRLTRRSLEDLLNRIALNANVENVHPHRFRRTSATDLLNAGMPIEQVQELLGHKNIETTRIYCTINQEAVKHNHKRCMNFKFFYTPPAIGRSICAALTQIYTVWQEYS